jgi:hypothetical protein
MKRSGPFVFLFIAPLLISISGCGSYAEGVSASATPTDDQHGDHARSETDGVSLVVDQIADVSCGQCQFDMEGSGCDLAVRLDGKAYYVDESSIDDHGDAHGDDGMCECVRKAEVKGVISEGRFVANSFELMPAGDSGE